MTTLDHFYALLHTLSATPSLAGLNRAIITRIVTIQAVKRVMFLPESVNSWLFAGGVVLNTQRR